MLIILRSAVHAESVAASVKESSQNFRLTNTRNNEYNVQIQSVRECVEILEKYKTLNRNSTICVTESNQEEFDAANNWIDSTIETKYPQYSRTTVLDMFRACNSMREAFLTASSKHNGYIFARSD